MDDTQKNLLNQLKEPLKTATKELTISSKQIDNEKNYDEDYKFARKKLRELVKVGEEAITEFMQIASETKEPFAFKTLSDLVKTVGELTNSIINNAKTKSDIDKNLGNVSSNGSTSVTQNNAIYVGSSSDIIDIIKKQNEKIQEDLKIIDAEVVEDGKVE